MGYEDLQGKAREEFWREIVTGQAESVFSYKKYCISKGVNYERFLYWQNKFRIFEKCADNSLIKKETDFITVGNFIDKDEISVDSVKEEYPNIELDLPFGIKLRMSGVSK